MYAKSTPTVIIQLFIPYPYNCKNSTVMTEENHGRPLAQ